MDVQEQSLGWLWRRQVEAGEQVALPRCPPMPVKDGERKSDWKDVRCGSEFWTGQRLPAEETPREQEDYACPCSRDPQQQSAWWGQQKALPPPQLFRYHLSAALAPEEEVSTSRAALLLRVVFNVLFPAGTPWLWSWHWELVVTVKIPNFTSKSFSHS